jgi:hypothetical protein
MAQFGQFIYFLIRLNYVANEYNLPQQKGDLQLTVAAEDAADRIQSGSA